MSTINDVISSGITCSDIPARPPFKDLWAPKHPAQEVRALIILRKLI